MYGFIDCHLQDGDVAVIVLSNGKHTIELVAGIKLVGRIASLTGVHIQGPGPNMVGVAELRALARWTKGQLDVDELRIEGAVRTSGACPGRKPFPLVFR